MGLVMLYTRVLLATSLLRKRRVATCPTRLACECRIRMRTFPTLRLYL